MNRKQFFKKLGIGAAVCIAAPEVLKALSETTAPDPDEVIICLYADGVLIAEAKASTLSIDDIDYESPDWKDEIKNTKEWSMEYQGDYLQSEYSYQHDGETVTRTKAPFL